MNKPNSKTSTFVMLFLMSCISSVIVFLNHSIFYSLILSIFAISNIVLSSSASEHANSVLLKNGPVVSEKNAASIKEHLSHYYVTVNSYLLAFSLLHTLRDWRWLNKVVSNVINKFSPSNTHFAGVPRVFLVTLLLVLLSILFELLFVAVNCELRKHLDRQISRENESE